MKFVELTNPQGQKFWVVIEQIMCIEPLVNSEHHVIRYGWHRAAWIKFVEDPVQVMERIARGGTIGGKL